VENTIILAVESEILERALTDALARFLALGDIRCVAIGSGQEHRAAGCVAWSGRSRLCTKPELTWLAETDAPHLRLPATLGGLRSFLGQVEAFAKTQESGRSPSTPLGLLLLAVDSAVRAADTGDESIQGRVRELQRFAQKHWPGVFDSALRGVEEHLSQGNLTDAAEVLSRVGREAPSAVFHHCVQWLDESEVRMDLEQGITLLQAATATPDALDEADLMAIVGRDWCSPALGAVRASEAGIREMVEGGVSLPADIVKSFRQLSKAVSGLAAACSKLTSRGKQQSGGRRKMVDWKKVASLCQQVSDTSVFLRLDAERVRKALESESTAGPRRSTR